MSSAVSNSAIVGVDWGSTSFRAYLMDAAGTVIDRRNSNQGAMAAAAVPFDAILSETLRGWSVPKSVPVIATGMVTARGGWVETPYIELPASLDIFAQQVIPLQTRESYQAYFVSGAVDRQRGTPDVMRGEEVQIIGAHAEEGGDAIYVLPGTHSKWANVKNAVIEGFATYMTGDAFAALRDHTVLSKLIDGHATVEEIFKRGVMAALDDDGGLLNLIFSARTLPLFSEIPANATHDYLSGILIGAEISSAKRRFGAIQHATLIGGSALVSRYEIAMALAGFKTKRAPDDIVARGHYLIAKSRGLLS